MNQTDHDFFSVQGDIGVAFETPSGWRKPVSLPNTDSHETRIAALEADIEELRQALSRILPTIEELETWIGD